jgi:hypothetical protein
MRIHSLLQKRNKQYVHIKNHYCCVDLLGGTLEYEYQGLDEATQRSLLQGNMRSEKGSSVKKKETPLNENYTL